MTHFQHFLLVRDRGPERARLVPGPWGVGPNPALLCCHWPLHHFSLEIVTTFQNPSSLPQPWSQPCPQAGVYPQTAGIRNNAAEARACALLPHPALFSQQGKGLPVSQAALSSPSVPLCPFPSHACTHRWASLEGTQRAGPCPGSPSQ